MNTEGSRLETFSDWPTDAEVNPQRIAKAGFFSTKQGLEVECFACHVKISEWNYGDQVMARHIALSPTCPFVVNPNAAGNVPITPYAQQAAPSGLQCYRESYEMRLSTFENWPASNIVSPESLARAGFYYLKDGDNTKCAICKGVVRAWEPGDDPDVEHKRHFPTCPFVVNVINPRISRATDVDNMNVTIDKNNFPNVSIINNEQNLGELGVQAHRGPKRANFSTVDSRLRSFVGWSSDLIQTPDILSQAGFYYEGMGDQVRCFHCDGGLRHWDPHDDPWTEHARWFPSCSFVKLVKGQEFVTACSVEPTTSSVSRQSVQKIRSSRRRREVTDREIQEELSSPTSLAALSIGLNLETVKRAIRDKLERTGRAYSQADALVEAALNIQHEQEDSTNDETGASDSVREAVSSALSDIVASSTSRDQSITLSIGDQPRHTFDHPGRGVSLEEENRLLKEARQCKICMDAEVGIVFLPCGHLVTCVNCAPNLEDCPVCRSTIKASVRTFLS